MNIWDQIKNAWQTRPQWQRSVPLPLVTGLRSENGFLVAQGNTAFAASLRYYYQAGGYASEMAGVTFEMAGRVGATGVIDPDGSLFLLMLAGTRTETLDSMLSVSGYRRVYPVPKRRYEVWGWWKD
jgi:hypothetical protein